MDFFVFYVKDVRNIIAVKNIQCSDSARLFEHSAGGSSFVIILVTRQYAFALSNYGGAHKGPTDDALAAITSGRYVSVANSRVNERKRKRSRDRASRTPTAMECAPNTICVCARTGSQTLASTSAVTSAFVYWIETWLPTSRRPTITTDRRVLKSQLTPSEILK